MNLEYLIDEIERIQSEATVNVIESMIDYNDKMEVIQECVNDNPDMFSEYFQEGAIDNVKMKGKSDSNKLVTAIKFLPRLIMELIKQAKLKLKRHPENLSKDEVEHIHRICDQCVKNTDTRVKVDKKLEKRGLKILKVVSGAAVGLVIGYKLTTHIQGQRRLVESRKLKEELEKDEEKREKFEEENKTYKEGGWYGTWKIGLKNNKLYVVTSHDDRYLTAVEQLLDNPIKFYELDKKPGGIPLNVPSRNATEKEKDFKDGYKAYIKDLDRSLKILSKFNDLIKNTGESNDAGFMRKIYTHVIKSVEDTIDEAATFLDACDILIAEGKISGTDASTISKEDREGWRKNFKDKGLTLKNNRVMYDLEDKGDK